jgi:hypothetical protein
MDVSLYERYELLELDRDDGVKTFQGREIATGRPVKVHLFVAPASPYQAQLWKKIDELPESERARVLDRGKHEGTRYLVTDRLVDYAGLFEWISASLKKADGKKPLETAGAWKVPRPAPTQASSEAPPVPAPATSSATPQSSAPSVPVVSSGADLNREFADLFKTTERPIFSPPPDPAVSVPTAPAPVVQAPVVQTPAVPAPTVPVPAVPVPAAGAPAPPGEFTRMFLVPGAAGSSSPPVQVPVASPDRPAVNQPAPVKTGKEPGEFTRMFQAPGGTQPASSQSPHAAAPPTQPAAGPKGAPGEFTMFFEAQ